MKNLLLKRIIICSLILTMTLCMSPVTAFADDSIDNASANSEVINQEDDNQESEPEVITKTDEEDLSSSSTEEDGEVLDEEDFEEEEPDIDLKELLSKPYIAVVNNDHWPEEGDFDYTFLYCEADTNMEEYVDGLDYDYNGVLTLSGYKGNSLVIGGGDEMHKLKIKVAKASTINVGTDSEATACIFAQNVDIDIIGTPKLTLNGKKISYYDDEGEVSSTGYPDGIAILGGNLNLKDANIASKYNEYGIYVDGAFTMKGGSFVTTYNKFAAIEATTIDLKGGKLPTGYYVKSITPTDYEEYADGTYPWFTIGKNGVSFNNGSYNSLVAKNITVKGGNNVSGVYGDFTWSLNSKGVLTINGEGELYYIADEEGNYDYTIEPSWNDYDYAVKSVVLGEGITEFTQDLIPYQIKSISLPSTLSEVSGWEFTNFENLTEIKVSKYNPDFTAVSGVLFNKSKTVLVAFPEAKTKSYTIPDSVKVIGSGAFFDSRLSTLTLSKALEEIEAYGIYSDNIKTIKVKLGNTHFTVKNGVLICDGEILQWYSPANTNLAYTVPDGITKVASAAFNNNNIRAIYMPESIELIEEDSIYGEHLYDVFFRGDAPTIDGYNYYGNIIVLKSKTGWDQYKSDFTIVEVDDIDNYYPSEIHFDKSTYEMDVYNYIADSEDEDYECGVEMTLCSEQGDSLLYNCNFKPSSSNLDLYPRDVYDEYDEESGEIQPNDFIGEDHVLYAESEYAGTYKVTATLPNGVSCSCNVIVSPVFEYDYVELYAGQKFKNAIIGTKGTVRWSTSNKAVATVDSKGKVTAKNNGQCKIKATYAGKTYEYPLTVCREAPGYQDIFVSEYNYSNNCFYVYATNYGETNLVVYSSGARSEDYEDEYFDRTLKMSTTSVTIKPGETKKLTFKVNGSKLYYYDEDDDFCVYDAEDATLYVTMALNGVKYQTLIDTEGAGYYDQNDDEWYDMASFLE